MIKRFMRKLRNVLAENFCQVIRLVYDALEELPVL